MMKSILFGCLLSVSFMVSADEIDEFFLQVELGNGYANSCVQQLNNGNTFRETYDCKLFIVANKTVSKVLKSRRNRVEIDDRATSSEKSHVYRYIKYLDKLEPYTR